MAIGAHSTRDQEIALLKWIAGSNRYEDVIHNTEGIDEERFLILIRKHRLTYRLLARLREKNASIFSASFIKRLLQHKLEIAAAAKQQLLYLQELSHTFDIEQCPILIIKGLSSYALTNNERYLKGSGDIDVICQDNGRLYRHLRGTGFVVSKNPAPHEYANLTRQGEMKSIELDIHRYFETYSYPPGIEHIAYEKKAGEWGNGPSNGTGGLVETRIVYEDIMKHSMRGSTPETERLYFPDFNMNVLLLSVNMFRKYVWWPVERYSAINLGDLCEIAEFINHPLFRYESWVELVERFNTQTPVRFVSMLLHELLEDDSLLDIARNLTPSKGSNDFPLFLGGIFLKQGQTDYLIHRDVDDMIAFLGVNDLYFESPSLLEQFIELGHGTQHNYECIADMKADYKLTITITVGTDQDHLQVSVSLLHPRISQEDLIVRCYFIGTGQFVKYSNNLEFKTIGVECVYDEEPCVRHSCGVRLTFDRRKVFHDFSLNGQSMIINVEGNGHTVIMPLRLHDADLSKYNKSLSE